MRRRDERAFVARFEYVAQLRETVRLTGMLRERDVPKETADALLAQFATWKRGEP